MWGFVFAVSLFAMSGKLRSRTITEGVQRSPNRAMLRAVGFGDRDFEKPIVGVANAHSTITPCNVGLDRLARRAEAALKAAGAMPQTFGTIDRKSTRLNSSHSQISYAVFCLKK